MSASNATQNHGSRRTARFTAPLNSCSIRETSSATRWRSSPAPSIKASTDRLWVVGQAKSSLMVDKFGEVAIFMVERATGIQSRPPPVQPTANSTSRRFGNLEKLKDRSKASRPTTSEGGNSVSTSSARTRGQERGGELTREGDRVCKLHEGPATGFYEPHSREETLVRSTNLHPGEM